MIMMRWRGQAFEEWMACTKANRKLVRSVGKVWLRVPLLPSSPPSLFLSHLVFLPALSSSDLLPLLRLGPSDVLGSTCVRPDVK